MLGEERSPSAANSGFFDALLDSDIDAPTVQIPLQITSKDFDVIQEFLYLGDCALFNSQISSDGDTSKNHFSSSVLIW